MIEGTIRIWGIGDTRSIRADGFVGVHSGFGKVPERCHKLASDRRQCDEERNALMLNELC